MPFKVRPIRPQIFRPVVRLGVNDADWPFVILFTAAGYAIPFFLNLNPYGIPLPFISCFSILAGSIAFFNWARIGRRPRWLHHQFTARLVSAVRRRELGRDWETRRDRATWILDADQHQDLQGGSKRAA